MTFTPQHGICQPSLFGVPGTHQGTGTKLPG